MMEFEDVRFGQSYKSRIKKNEILDRIRGMGR